LPRKKPQKSHPPKPETPRRAQQRGSDWNKDFGLKKGLKVWQAAEASGPRTSEDAV
jgi:hypothetical protein